METQQNEENAATYTHYITWGDARRFFLTLAAGGLAVLNFLLIIQAWKMLRLGELTMRQPYSWGQLVICWAFGGEYVIIACTAVCITATIKGGFRNLKPINEDGLIDGLIIGLIGGLIIGLIFGLIIWLIGGIISVLIGGIIGGIISGLIIGLIFGLIFGLIGEFTT